MNRVFSFMFLWLKVLGAMVIIVGTAIGIFRLIALCHSTIFIAGILLAVSVTCIATAIWWEK